MSKKKALLLVPHQDDEINLIGNIFEVISEKYELFVVYSSLDQDTIKGNIRKEEAYNSCAIFGIERKHITFLEYPDTRPHSCKHFFMEGDKSIISVIKNYIDELRPEVIFATDYDRHWDHKMLSLAFEEAMGCILKEHPNYQPLVLKGFCYETGCCGLMDYRASIPEETKIIGEIQSNRSVEWKDRISISGNCRPMFIWNTKAYKALAQHKSQLIKLSARSIINADNVFWIKRTDNLMLHASISSETGDVSKLNDFMICDTYDLETSDVDKIDFSKGVWKVEQKTAMIRVKWNNNIMIDRLIFHGNPSKKDDQFIDITVSTYEKNEICVLHNLRAYGRKTEIRFEQIETDHLCISLKTKDSSIELSEIEALYGDDDIGNLKKILFKEESNRFKENFLIDLLNNIGCEWISCIEKAKRKLINIR